MVLYLRASRYKGTGIRKSPLRGSFQLSAGTGGWLAKAGMEILLMGCFCRGGVFALLRQLVSGLKQRVSLRRFNFVIPIVVTLEGSTIAMTGSTIGIDGSIVGMQKAVIGMAGSGFGVTGSMIGMTIVFIGITGMTIGMTKSIIGIRRIFCGV